jgi:hypothetical protein
MRLLHQHSNNMIGRRGALRGLLLPILAAPMALATRTASAKEPPLPPWKSAEVLIGSTEDQVPSPKIECPMFFGNGNYAQAAHTLDLSKLPLVRGSIIRIDEKIEPDFSASIAAEIAEGTDGFQYLLVAGEGTVSDGTGYFNNVTQVIIRCKYKVQLVGGSPLLIACVNCVAILVRE